MWRVLPLLLLAAACELDVSPRGGIQGGNGNGNGGGGDPTVSFALDILPLFQQDCTFCHGGAGGLNLESYAALFAGGNSGPQIIPGDAENSLLPRRLDGRIPPIMPLDAAPLTDPEIERIKQWIREGALDN